MIRKGGGGPQGETIKLGGSDICKMVWLVLIWGGGGGGDFCYNYFKFVFVSIKGEWDGSESDTGNNLVRITRFKLHSNGSNNFQQSTNGSYS